MEKNRTFHKKKTVFVFACCVLILIGLVGRLVYLDGIPIRLLCREGG